MSADNRAPLVNAWWVPQLADPGRVQHQPLECPRDDRGWCASTSWSSCRTVLRDYPIQWRSGIIAILQRFSGGSVLPKTGRCITKRAHLIMRDAHHMNASGACPVYRQLRLSREGRGGGVAIAPVEMGAIRVSYQLPGSHLLLYLIPGDVPRSFLSSYLGAGPRSPLHSAQIPVCCSDQIRIASRRVFCIHTFILVQSSDQGVMPLFVCSEDRQWSAVALFHLDFPT